MRILHVVTLVSPDGAYGGPVRVALNQAQALVALGHEVTVAAATRGYQRAPTALDGVALRLFPARTLLPRTGFAGLGAPALIRWFRRHAGDFDVAHFHLGRDLVTLPAAALARRRVPYVVQTHGMVIPSHHPLAAPLDMFGTRPVLRDARAVFHLTPLERAQLIVVAGPRLRLVPLRNGVPRPPLWPTQTGEAEVLFAARLHARKRPTAFVEIAHALLAEGIQAQFSLIGPDEGEGAAVQTAIAGEPRIEWLGPLAPAAVPARMATASVFVLPAMAEPFPMAVLEAMSVGIPVVVATDCGLAETIERTGSGIVASADVIAMTAAVRTLLLDPGAARRMGERGRRTVSDEFTMSAVAEVLDRIYKEVAGYRT
ncbi:glycosyltransferase [Aldersonia sp. NBC_00410]|uniref:glycosyltransferase n=1 Tax=Aldersonia sp. NBC_00410 TaxID=2975954 RepID=UPI002255BF92|nr:glycosyltransferase [Aldersonia sp. NBC_00410]MCX5041694.1 glycosyltransferase [Aldersonia sp. NBC_00410]